MQASTAARELNKSLSKDLNAYPGVLLPETLFINKDPQRKPRSSSAKKKNLNKFSNKDMLGSPSLPLQKTLKRRQASVFIEITFNRSFMSDQGTRPVRRLERIHTVMQACLYRNLIDYSSKGIQG